MISKNKKTIIVISIFLSIFSTIKSDDEKPPCKTVEHCVYCPLIHQCEICEKEYSLNDDKSTCIYHMSHIYGLSKFGGRKNDEVKSENDQVASNKVQQVTKKIVRNVNTANTINTINDIEDIKFVLFKIIFCVVLLVLLILLLIYICYMGCKRNDLNTSGYNVGEVKKVSIK